MSRLLECGNSASWGPSGTNNDSFANIIIRNKLEAYAFCGQNRRASRGMYGVIFSKKASNVKQRSTYVRTYTLGYVFFQVFYRYAGTYYRKLSYELGGHAVYTVRRDVRRCGLPHSDPLRDSERGLPSDVVPARVGPAEP